MKYFLFSLFIFISTVSNSQIYLTSEFKKEQSIYKAKEFIMTEILGVDTSLTRFEIDVLSAASSGELTSLVYRCDEKDLTGLIFGFFGIRRDESGLVYRAYAFKNLLEKEAVEFLSKLDSHIEKSIPYLNNPHNNSVFFKYEDMTILISGNTKYRTIRVFWNGFDSEWISTSFNKTKKRFVKHTGAY